MLLITVAGTLFIMNIYGIELQRISLGALVIALGTLVDRRPRRARRSGVPDTWLVSCHVGAI